MRKKQNILSFYLLKGNVEILKFLDNNSPMQFKDIRDITNPKTSKKFSSRTVSLRLKELENSGDIKNEIVINSKRKSIGYAITEKGRQSLEIIRETEKKFEKLKKKTL